MNILGIGKLVEGVGGLVDKFIQTKDEKAAFILKFQELADKAEEQAQESMNKAREAYIAEWQYSTHDTRFDKIVDAANRLVRPMVTYGLIALLFGLVDIPKEIPSDYWNVLLLVIGFWFGGRLLKRDGGAEVLQSFSKK